MVSSCLCHSLPCVVTVASLVVFFACLAFLLPFSEMISSPRLLAHVCSIWRSCRVETHTVYYLLLICGSMPFRAFDRNVCNSVWTVFWTLLCIVVVVVVLSFVHWWYAAMKWRENVRASPVSRDSVVYFLYFVFFTEKFAVPYAPTSRSNTYAYCYALVRSIWIAIRQRLKWFLFVFLPSCTHRLYTW